MASAGTASRGGDLGDQSCVPAHLQSLCLHCVTGCTFHSCQPRLPQRGLPGVFFKWDVGPFLCQVLVGGGLGAFTEHLLGVQELVVVLHLHSPLFLLTALPMRCKVAT